MLIRAAEPDKDAASLAHIYAPYVRKTVISFEEDPPSAGEMAQRVRHLLPNFPFLLCEAEGEAVGFAYGGQHRSRAAYRWSVDVSVYVREDRQRQGIGRALYINLFRALARQGFHQAFAGITLPNENSVGLHEAMGFSLVGVYPEVGYKFGAWRDVGWWRRPLAEASAPTEPVPFTALKL